MCLNEAYINFSQTNIHPIGPRQEECLLSQLFNSALEYALEQFKKSRRDKLKGKHQVLVSADDIN
jgi:hypothetical protein